MKFFRKYHKWVGLFFSFFIIMFCFSGVVLNHRRAFSGADVSRSWLPKNYRYDNWNNGAVKGSFPLSTDSILLYGGSGIWLTDAKYQSFINFTEGFKKGTDNQSVTSIVKTVNNKIYASTTFDIYKLQEGNSWENCSKALNTKERICNLAVKGDTLVVLTRSYVYSSIYPYNEFTKLELQKPEEYKAEYSLFRTIWLLHSGELFGLPGKIVVDILGILLIVLCVTGIIFTFCPSIIKRKKKKDRPTKKPVSLMKSSIKWHNKIGVWLLVLFLILAISGMFLRPPLMIAIIRAKVKAIPGTILNEKNPWHDKLRTLRYDSTFDEWLLYSSSGFYKMGQLTDIPERIKKVPPISVMGVNVLEPIDSTKWAVGSFSGLYSWNRETDEILDFYTNKPLQPRAPGRPTISSTAVSGFVNDFKGKAVAFEYSKGAKILGSKEPFIEMPKEIKKGRMSLWHFCLEIHVGRAYHVFLGPFSDLFVFLSGLILSFILISGYIVYRKRYCKKKKKNPPVTSLPE